MSQFNQQLLVAQQLAVHERHIEEVELRSAKAAVKPIFDTLPGQGHGLRIGCKRPGRPPKHIAGELIEHDDQGEQGLWCLAPPIQLPRTSRFVRL
jgi:hypothetical protein